MKTDNELIADFMGLKSFEDSRYGTLWPSPLKAKTPATCFGLCYHESWDWLMPVIEKIHKIPLTTMTDEWADVITKPIYAPINEVYEVVVDFIKWHNSQVLTKQ